MQLSGTAVLIKTTDPEVIGTWQCLLRHCHQERRHFESVTTTSTIGDGTSLVTKISIEVFMVRDQGLVDGGMFVSERCWRTPIKKIKREMRGEITPLEDSEERVRRPKRHQDGSREPWAPSPTGFNARDVAERLVARGFRSGDMLVAEDPGLLKAVIEELSGPPPSMDPGVPVTRSSDGTYHSTSHRRDDECIDPLDVGQPHCQHLFGGYPTGERSVACERPHFFDGGISPHYATFSGAHEGENLTRSRRTR